MTQHGLGQVSRPEIFYFSNSFSILSILTMHKCFPGPEGCEGIFKNQKFKLNKNNFI